MTTTAFDDQFTAAPVHERYDVVTILRRNVAALELALKRQTDRAAALAAEVERLNAVISRLSVEGQDAVEM